MATSVDLTQTIMFTAVRAFLLGLLGSSFQVQRGQQNRSAPPKTGDYIVLVPLLRERLATNVETWDPTANPPISIVQLVASKITIQCDVYGPFAADNAAIIESAWRSPYGCDTLAALTSPAGLIAPLYIEPGRQLVFIDAQQQFEERWTLDLVLEANQTITLTQDFMNAIIVGLVPVDAFYPKPGQLDFSDEFQSGLLPGL